MQVQQGTAAIPANLIGFASVVKTHPDGANDLAPPATCKRAKTNKKGMVFCTCSPTQKQQVLG